jgi:uroporphyrinogen decarboxylase
MSDRPTRCASSASVGDDVPVMGWVEGAFAPASDLRGDQNILLDIHDRPEWLKALLDRLMEVGVAFARAQVAAGAHVVGLGDSMGSLVSPRQYREFVLPCEQRVFAAVKEAGAIPRLHICGNTNHLLPDMASSGAQIVDLDWMVDLRRAAEVFGPLGPAPCGNFDPVAVMLQGTPEEVAEAVRGCAAAAGPRHFSAAGCEVPDGTPEENLLAHARTLRSSAPERPPCARVPKVLSLSDRQASARVARSTRRKVGRPDRRIAATSGS